MIIKIIVAVVLVSALVIAYLLITAPQGVEDENGFHVVVIPKTGGKEK